MEPILVLPAIIFSILALFAIGRVIAKYIPVNYRLVSIETNGTLKEGRIRFYISYTVNDKVHQASVYSAGLDFVTEGKVPEEIKTEVMRWLTRERLTEMIVRLKEFGDLARAIEKLKSEQQSLALRGLRATAEREHKEVKRAVKKHKNLKKELLKMFAEVNPATPPRQKPWLTQKL